MGRRRPGLPAARAFARQRDVILLGRRDTRRAQRNRAVGRRAVIGPAITALPISWPAIRFVGIIRRRRRRRRRRRVGWPARLIADGGGRAKVLVGKTETAIAFAERCDLEREIGATGAGTGNRTDPNQIRALLDAA